MSASFFKKPTQLLLAFLALLSCSFLYAQDDWSLEKDKDGISIYSRAVDYSDFKEFRAEVTLNASIDTVIAIFQDPNSFTRWVHQCSSAEVIQQESFLDIYVYQVSDMPLLVSDRDIVIRDVYSYSEDYSHWAIDVQAIDGMVDKTDMIRINNSKGIYNLYREENGETKIVWFQHADPAGALPSWLVNSLIVDFPYNTLNSLRALSQEAKYKTAKIGYDDQGVPTHWAIRDF